MNTTFHPKKKQNFAVKVTLALALAVSFTLAGTDLWAATYYVNGAAANDAGNGSESAPKKYISSGILLMAGGDTLIIEDGVYTGTLNMIGPVAPRAFPPAGLDRDHPTTVKARNVGGAIIDANYADIPFTNANQKVTSNYLHIDGIHFRHGNGGVFEIKGHYSRVTNCGFEDGQSATSTAQVPIADIVGSDSSYVVFEDCWAWGKGRYGIYFGGSSPGVDHSIFRRVVVRQDDAATGPVGGIMFYNGHDNLCQNCFVLDGTDSSTSEHYGAFSATANYPSTGPTTLNHQVVGSLAINNAKLHGYQPQYNIGTFTIKDTVLWGNGKSGVVTGSNTIGTTVVDHATIGGHAVDGVGSNPYYTNSFINVSNSISTSNARYGIYYGKSVSYLDLYNNAQGASIGTTVTNPISTNPYASSLKYLPRIEKGATLSGTGTTGDVGANILYQVGASGTFYGDAGWDAVTTNPVWPLPNEAIWTAKIKAYNASGPGGNRGFAAVNSANPVTDYIWGYLGSTVPPFSVQAKSTAGGVVLSWTAASANANLTGYRVHVGTASGKYDLAGYQGGLDVGNVTSTVLTGLPSGQTCYIAVTAVDAVKGESGISYETSIALNDTTPPTVSFATPSANAVVTGTTAVNVAASDAVGVTRVDFYVNGALQGSATAAPYLFNWDTTRTANALCTLTAKAYDAAGNVAQSDMSVTVRNDVTPPSVSITAPAAGTIGGNVTISAAASDDFGVTRVDIFINGSLRASSNTTPYGYTWNTASEADGTYVISARAYDAAGNVGTSSNLAVTVFNDRTAPVVTIAAPAAGATVGGRVTVSANATDNVGVTKVEFYLNGVLTSSASAAPYAFVWDTGTVANGSYSLVAKGYDAAGNVGVTSASIVVFNDREAPVVALVPFTTGASVSGTIQIGATASDNVGVTLVEFYVDGTLVGSAAAAPYQMTWDTTTDANGSYVLSALAYDAAGNVGPATPVTLQVLNDVIPPTVTIDPLRAKVTSDTVTLSGTVSDNVAVAKVFAQLGNGDPIPAVIVQGVWTCNVSGLVYGENTVTITATDTSGNTATSLFRVRRR